MVQFMVILDVAIVNVALPSIQTDLGFSQENLQWVISAYALVFGGFLLLGGRLADLLGRRRVFMSVSSSSRSGRFCAGFPGVKARSSPPAPSRASGLRPSHRQRSRS
jgi:MFS family permease